MDLYDQIYYSLIGELEEDTALDWVNNAFAPGSPCAQAYSRAIAARNRVLEKLGKTEDEDLEALLGEMTSIQRLLSRALLELRKL